MTLYRMFDASVPPGAPYPGSAAAAGYIGGRTPRVWTAAEWNQASGQGLLRQLPIWVADLTAGAEGPATQGWAAADAAIRLGWAPHAHNRRAIACDMETAVDEIFLAEFTGVVHSLGFSVWPYGSQNFLFADPPEDGYWVAAYPGPGPNLNFPGERVVAHQFAADVPWMGGLVDLSVIDGAALPHLGIGLRRAAETLF